MDLLDYELSGDGIRASKVSTEKIIQLQTPTNIKEVRRVLGVVNYYRMFIPKMNDLVMPIQALLKKQSLTKWKWSKECDDALNKIKTIINKREALAPFETDEKKNVLLSGDASDIGMGAVLEQEQADGTMRPVLYWSSQFRKYELNYSVSEKEALVCVAAVTKMKKYLLGRTFTLKTDHRALETLLSQKKANKTSARTERWREKVSQFDYNVEYIKGADNEIAD